MQFINRYFGALLLLSCFIGMVMPSFGEKTPVIIMVALAFIIFCSFFQINFSLRALTADFRLTLKFYAMRYIMLPVLSFLALKWFSEFYALVLLLSFLLPAAVSSPSFTILFGGKPELSLKILIISSFLSVISIPVFMSLLPGHMVNVRAGEMLMTLVYTIVVPFLLHLPLRNIIAVRNTISRFNSLFTLTGLGTIFVVATARNRPAILGNPGLVGLYAAEALLLYTFLYWLGHVLLSREPAGERRTMAISSGANNIGLGVTITALFFPGKMNIFFIVSQLAWVVMLIPLRKWMGKTHGLTQHIHR